MLRGVWLIVGVLLASAAVRAQETGRICGTVRTERGAPAAGVHVEAMDAGQGHSGPLQGALTKDDGSYCIVGLEFGDQWTLSVNESAKGYPNTWATFYGVRSGETHIRLSPQTQTVVANWSIPFKAGFLYLHLTDGRTGKPLADGAYQLAVAGSEETRSMRGSFGVQSPLLLPPDETVLVRVDKPGYRGWPEGGSAGRPVLVAPGASLTLDVALTPSQ